MASSSADIVRTSLFHNTDQIKKLLLSKIEDKAELVREILSTEDLNQRKVLIRALPSHTAIIHEALEMFNDLDDLVLRIEKAEKLEIEAA